MDVKFLKSGTIQYCLEDLIEQHDEIHWAVAWGVRTPLAERLFAHSSKFCNVTFGVAFSQTDPYIVDSLISVPNAYVATKFPDGTFHPKVYGFRSRNLAAAIIGSANFTQGGLVRNHEASVLITGQADEPTFVDILKFTKDSASYGQEVSKAYADAYRASYKRASRMPKPPRDPVALDKAGAVKLMTMDWAEYVQGVRTPRGHHEVDQSLELLGIARRWFAETSSFTSMTVARRKALAGILGEQEKTDAELNRNWGWFGSMRGAGDFKNRVSQNDSSLARAVDCIPRSGDVTQTQFERFCEAFLQAFTRSQRNGGVATASRLLAMKRPDTFLCVCKPNIASAANELGFARTTLNLSNYWERIVEPIRASTWYNADKPDGSDGELWEARAAMLDAILYEP